MNKIKNIIELLGTQKELHKQLQEVQSKLDPITQSLRDLNDNLVYSQDIYNFLCDKILETYGESEIENVKAYREKLDSNIYTNDKTFDPYNDSWYIYDYEQEGDNIRFLVSCRKNEGSISGLMTFLDTHFTAWIKISELEEFNID